MYQFMAADYYATGEGRTICLLITRAYHRQEDWIQPPQYIKKNDKYELVPGQERIGPKLRTFREFSELFGGYLAQGAEVHTQEEFMNKYDAYVPLIVKNMLQSTDGPGNLHWYQQFHCNFS